MTDRDYEHSSKPSEQAAAQDAADDLLSDFAPGEGQLREE
jgi:hypothetical protein